MSILVGFLYVIEVLVCLLLGLVPEAEGGRTGRRHRRRHGRGRVRRGRQQRAHQGHGLARRDLPGQHASSGAPDVHGELFAHGRRGRRASGRTAADAAGRRHHASARCACGSSRPNCPGGGSQGTRSCGSSCSGGGAQGACSCGSSCSCGGSQGARSCGS